MSTQIDLSAVATPNRTPLPRPHPAADVIFLTRTVAVGFLALAAGATIPLSVLALDGGFGWTSALKVVGLSLAVAVPLLVVLGLPAILVLTKWRSRMQASPGAARRYMALLALGLSAVVSVIVAVIQVRGGMGPAGALVLVPSMLLTSLICVLAAPWMVQTPAWNPTR